MDEKVFNLLETMYPDLSSKIDNMDNELKELKINVATKHDIVRLENKMDENIERQDVEIRVIKRVK